MMYKNFFSYMLMPLWLVYISSYLEKQKNDAKVSNISEENYYFNDT